LWLIRYEPSRQLDHRLFKPASTPAPFLEILDRITEIAPLNHGQKAPDALAVIRGEFPSVTDFERDFPSLCFALATSVSETQTTIYMFEPKASNQMEDATVLAKKDAAIKWCLNASEHAATCGGKPWQYVLIPHNVITENMTISGLTRLFGH